MPENDNVNLVGVRINVADALAQITALETKLLGVVKKSELLASSLVKTSVELSVSIARTTRALTLMTTAVETQNVALARRERLLRTNALMGGDLARRGVPNGFAPIVAPGGVLPAGFGSIAAQTAVSAGVAASAAQAATAAAVDKTVSRMLGSQGVAGHAVGRPAGYLPYYPDGNAGAQARQSPLFNRFAAAAGTAGLAAGHAARQFIPRVGRVLAPLASPLGVGIGGAFLIGGGLSSNVTEASLRYRLGTVSGEAPGFNRDLFTRQRLAKAYQFASNTGVNPLDNINVQYALISGGVPIPDVERASRVVQKVATITSGEPEGVGEILTTLSNNFRGTSFDKLGDLATQTQLQYQLSNFQQLGYGLFYGAGSAAGSNTPIEQLFATIGQLNNLGFPGSQAGTVYRNLSTRLQDPKIGNALNRYLRQLPDAEQFEVQRTPEGGFDIIGTATAYSHGLARVRDEVGADQAAQVAAKGGQILGPVLLALAQDADGLTKSLKTLTGAADGVVDTNFGAYTTTLGAKTSQYGTGIKNAFIGTTSLLGRGAGSLLDFVFSGIGVTPQNLTSFGNQLKADPQFEDPEVARKAFTKLLSGGQGAPISLHLDKNSAQLAREMLDKLGVPQSGLNLQISDEGESLVPTIGGYTPTARRYVWTPADEQAIITQTYIAIQKGNEERNRRLSLSEGIGNEQPKIIDTIESKDPNEVFAAQQLALGYANVLTTRADRRRRFDEGIGALELLNFDKYGPGQSERLAIDRGFAFSESRVDLQQSAAILQSFKGARFLQERQSKNLLNIFEDVDIAHPQAEYVREQIIAINKAQEGTANPPIPVPDYLGVDATKDEIARSFLGSFGDLPLGEVKRQLRERFDNANTARRRLGYDALPDSDFTDRLGIISRGRDRQHQLRVNPYFNAHERIGFNEAAFAASQAGLPHSFIQSVLASGDQNYTPEQRLARLTAITEGRGTFDEQQLLGRHRTLDAEQTRVGRVQGLTASVAGRTLGEDRTVADAKRALENFGNTEFSKNLIEQFDGVENAAMRVRQALEELAAPKTFESGLAESLREIHLEGENFNHTIGRDLPYSLKRVSEATVRAASDAAIFGGSWSDVADTFRTQVAQALSNLSAQIIQNQILSPLLFGAGGAQNPTGGLVEFGLNTLGSIFGFGGVSTPTFGQNYAPGYGGAYADGGLVMGRGTGRSDSIPARLSNGEFVINASATSRHMDLLRSINENRFAAGGFVGRDYSPVSESAQGGIDVTVNIEGGGDVATNARTQEKVGVALGDVIRGILVDESRAGGVLGRQFTKR